jgi:hypothetical protein
MTWKVDPPTEKGTELLIKKSSIKVIDVRRDSRKAQLIYGYLQAYFSVGKHILITPRQ